MLTIFAIPKPFKADFATIQYNAIISWSLLRPRPEIVLFGDEQGTADVAAGLGLGHVPGVRRNEYGTPMVDDILQQGQDLATHHLVCYVNADIILLSDFMRAVRQVASWRPTLLMIGRRWNISLAERIEFDRPDWESRLRATVLQRGKRFRWDAVDYFLFSRGLFRDIPPIAIGRYWWDTWLVWKALAQSIAVVDASRVVMAIHQNHPYDFPGGLAEERRNLELTSGAGWRAIADATHTLVIDEATLIKRRRLAPVRGACVRSWYKVNAVLLPPWFAILTATRSLRHYFGLRQENVIMVLAKLRSLRSLYRPNRK